MRKILQNLYDGICAVLKEAKDIHTDVLEAKQERERIYRAALEIRDRVERLQKDLAELKAEMEARGEAADEMTQKANRMFEEGMANLFGFNGAV